MATNISTLKIKISKINFNDFIATALEKFGESIGDMVVTVAVTGLALAYMSIVIQPYVVDLISGYYITAMLLQVLIRVVHRFDDSYTVQELAEQVLRIEEENNKRWDDFIHN
jgi:ABC-type thiamin/hydroxymethylpyrimidine transport system permease subunit